MDNFYKKSESLLLSILKEPGGFSFFPSSFFWKEENFDLQRIYNDFFASKLYTKKDDFTKNLLYIHIPFCSKICSYCNCFKYKIRKKEDIDIYIKYLEKEARMLFEVNNFQKIQIEGIFIGGWTPNILNIPQFSEIFSLIKRYFEISTIKDFILDWHPNFYTKEKILFLKNNWATRLTFAIQSFDKNVLLKNNRDFYDLEKLKKNISYARSIGLKINIDMLIGLNWQAIESFLSDMNSLNSINFDNLSVHYFMKSNNISYELDKNYSELVDFSKKFLKNNNKNISYSNIFEDHFASTKNTTLSLWASAVTNIFWEIIYSKPDTRKYYKLLDENILPFWKWFLLSKREEMIKYIYLNILNWINIKNFYNTYGENIFKEFFPEFSFLNNKKVIKIENWIIKTVMNDKDTLIYFNIFIMKSIKNIALWEKNVGELKNFFLDSWELIDK